MTMLVTGGAGFLGTRLIQRLLAGTAQVPAATRVICVDQVASPLADARVVSHVGSIADPGFVATAVEPDVTVIWHLAAVLSGQSDAEPALALTVNVGGTQALLEACRRLASPPRFVFASTIAVFGGPLPDVVPEDLALPRPTAPPRPSPSCSCWRPRGGAWWMAWPAACRPSRCAPVNRTPRCRAS